MQRSNCVGWEAQLVVLVNAEVGGKEPGGTSENGMKKTTDPTMGFPLHV
jgi:hypothetical protein